LAGVVNHQQGAALFRDVFQPAHLHAPVGLVHELEEGPHGVEEFPIQPPLVGLVLAGRAPLDPVSLILERAVEDVPHALPRVHVEKVLAEGALKFFQ